MAKNRLSLRVSGRIGTQQLDLYLPPNVSESSSNAYYAEYMQRLREFGVQLISAIVEVAGSEEYGSAEIQFDHFSKRV